MKKQTIKVECEHCGKETLVTVYPFVPARIYSPPEDCYPAEGPEADPSCCNNCNTDFDLDAIFDEASEQAQDEKEYFAELKADSDRERDFI